MKKHYGMKQFANVHIFYGLKTINLGQKNDNLEHSAKKCNFAIKTPLANDAKRV